MNDQELDRLIARANPFGDETVRQLPTDDAESDLLEEIMITAEPTPDRKPGSRRAMLVAAAAVAAVALLTSQVLTRGNTAAPAPGPAGSTGTSQVRTDGVDRLLLNVPGWKIETFMGGGGFDGGELVYANGKKRGLTIHWYPADQYQSYYDDRTDVSPRKPIEILGQKGSMVSYSADDHAAMFPPKGKFFLEIRGGAGSEQAYRDVLAKLYPVDTNTFVEALPGNVVKPADVEQVVAAMLADIPVPAGLNREKIYQTAPDARYQLGAKVTGSVSCIWLDKWVKAKKAGDTAGMQASVTAMNTSKSWKILKEMTKEGAYSAVIWDYADLIAAGKDPGQFDQGLGC